MRRAQKGIKMSLLHIQGANALLLCCALLVPSALGNGIQWNGNWASGCDFSGNDLSRAKVRGEECGGRCSSNPSCTHFTWTNFEGGTCFLKSGSISKANAFKTGDSTKVCGIIRESGQSVQGGSQTGKTTRYWDCCKPSCSWPGKADTTNPVKTCSKNGISQMWDNNAQSGCGGGDAFVCNDNIPWAINDNLAYGFAAAHIKGSDERGWCCGCYKLNFNSGPVNGKSMIVQVVNTGGDLGENHFDLQIPGGGVGIFNGCNKQWGVGGNAWGQQYGGVGSRGECNALPEPIRSGCFWRFDWFKGADNPTMTFSRVQCPAELERKSNCARR